MAEPLTKRAPRIWSEEAKKRMFFKKDQLNEGKFICPCHNREFSTTQTYGGHMALVKRKSTPRKTPLFCDECKKELPLDRQRFCSVKCFNISRGRKYRSFHKEEAFIRKETLKLFKRKSKCEICGTKDKLQFHHKVYRLPLREEDIITLCARCHIRTHQPKRIPAIYEVEKDE
jgi:hypothetical protein